MIELLSAIEFWHWWVLAALLIAVEVFAPTTLFLWTGLSAAVVGLVLYLVPDMDWEYQVLLFAVLSVLSVFVWRTYTRLRPTPTEDPSLNRRGAQYVDRVFSLDEAIVNRRGKLLVDGVIWSVEGDDLEAGVRVRVVGVENVVLKVERA
jgi:membrane protein implicated in regulation of membrane protease activity